MTTKHSLYLHNLILHNWATFHHQEIKFDKRFNAIIGETGSGKSLIINAIEIILGHRADKKLIRKDAPFATVEAIFYCNDQYVKNFLDELGHPCENNEIIIKRIIYPSTSSKSYLNYLSTNAETLIRFSTRFIDFVGQFENQKLLHANYQLKLLDQYGDLTELRKKFQQQYQEWKNLNKELQELKQLSADKNQRIDYLNFQLNEINDLNPSIEDEENLIKKKSHLHNQEKKVDTLKKILSYISENDLHTHSPTLTNQIQSTPALFLVKKALTIYEQNCDLISDESKELLKLLTDICGQLNEISFILNKDLSNTLRNSPEQTEQELEYILERLDLYQKIKFKHGPHISDILNFKKNIEVELAQFENIEDQIIELNKRIILHQQILLETATDLHIKRQHTSKQLSKILTSEIRQLKMDEASINITIEKIQTSANSETLNINENGISEIYFYVETNPGEGYHLLKDIISGGELSRILLALRQTLSTKDLISIFLFDEIDAGIGGETALNIGKALFKVAQNSQVVAITHLPQVAHSADKLIVVSKDYELDNSTNNSTKRTLSQIKEVCGVNKNKEIQAMLSLGQ